MLRVNSDDVWLASCFIFSFLCPCSGQGQFSCGPPIPQFILEVSISSWSLLGPEWLGPDFRLALSLHLTCSCRQKCGSISHTLWIASSDPLWEYDKWGKVGLFLRKQVWSMLCRHSVAVLLRSCESQQGVGEAPWHLRPPSH